MMSYSKEEQPATTTNKNQPVGNISGSTTPIDAGNEEGNSEDSTHLVQQLENVSAQSSPIDSQANVASEDATSATAIELLSPETLIETSPQATNSNQGSRNNLTHSRQPSIPLSIASHHSTNVSEDGRHLVVPTTPKRNSSSRNSLSIESAGNGSDSDNELAINKNKNRKLPSGETSLRSSEGYLSAEETVPDFNNLRPESRFSHLTSQSQLSARSETQSTKGNIRTSILPSVVRQETSITEGPLTPRASPTPQQSTIASEEYANHIEERRNPRAISKVVVSQGVKTAVMAMCAGLATDYVQSFYQEKTAKDFDETNYWHHVFREMAPYILMSPIWYGLVAASKAWEGGSLGGAAEPVNAASMFPLPDEVGENETLGAVMNHREEQRQKQEDMDVWHYSTALGSMTGNLSMSLPFAFGIAFGETYIGNPAITYFLAGAMSGVSITSLKMFSTVDGKPTHMPAETANAWQSVVNWFNEISDSRQHGRVSVTSYQKLRNHLQHMWGVPSQALSMVPLPTVTAVIPMLIGDKEGFGYSFGKSFAQMEMGNLFDDSLAIRRNLTSSNPSFHEVKQVAKNIFTLLSNQFVRGYQPTPDALRNPKSLSKLFDIVLKHPQKGTWGETTVRLMSPILNGTEALYTAGQIIVALPAIFTLDSLEKVERIGVSSLNKLLRIDIARVGQRDFFNDNGVDDKNLVKMHILKSEQEDDKDNNSAIAIIVEEVKDNDIHVSNVTKDIPTSLSGGDNINLEAQESFSETNHSSSLPTLIISDAPNNSLQLKGADNGSPIQPPSTLSAPSHSSISVVTSPFTEANVPVPTNVSELIELGSRRPDLFIQDIERTLMKAGLTVHFEEQEGAVAARLQGGDGLSNTGSFLLQDAGKGEGWSFAKIPEGINLVTEMQKATALRMLLENNSDAIDEALSPLTKETSELTPVEISEGVSQPTGNVKSTTSQELAKTAEIGLIGDNTKECVKAMGSDAKNQLLEAINALGASSMVIYPFNDLKPKDWTLMSEPVQDKNGKEIFAIVASPKLGKASSQIAKVLKMSASEFELFQKAQQEKNHTDTQQDKDKNVNLADASKNQNSGRGKSKLLGS